jgi:hypothetical protein
MLYHGSHKKITKIETDYNPYRIFGSFLFFGDRKTAESHGDYLYAIDDDKIELDIISPRHFYYEAFNNKKDINEVLEILKEFEDEIMCLCNCDRETAEEYLDETQFYNDDAEKSWEIQHIQAQAAVACSYDGIDVEDEHGTSTMIDMSNKKIALKEIN